MSSKDEERVLLGKNEFLNLIQKDGAELKLCPKLCLSHLNVRHSSKQRVHLATELFSETVSKAMIFYFGDAFRIQSEFIQTVNDWFDCFNSSSKFAVTACKSGFGVNLDQQMQALSKMENQINLMKFGNRFKSSSTKKPFQQGILTGIDSLKKLLEKFQEIGLEYVLTRRLNQDSLENTFSRLRSFGTTHPGPADVITKLKLLLVGKQSKLVINTAVELDPNSAMVSEEEDPGFVMQGWKLLSWLYGF